MNLLKKVMQNNENQAEIDNLKKEIFLLNQKYKDLFELVITFNIIMID